MTDRRSRAVRDMPLTRLVPNMLTLLSLCAGLTALRFGLEGRWGHAVLAILIAAVFDMLDGRVARLLNMSSRFGAELDSLSDLVSFGVAPALLLHFWILRDWGGPGWVAVLAFAVCAALRLARFNTMLDDHEAPAWTKSFFTGVPAPAGAGLAILPILFALQFGPGWAPPPLAVMLWLLVVGGLMVSRLPTLSLKGRRIAPIWVAPIMLIGAMMAASLVTNTWLTLCAAGIAYIVALPVGWINYRRKMRQN